MKKAICLVLAVLMIFAVCSCTSPEKAILGTWKAQSSVLGLVTETSYTFNEDGTGSKTNVLTVSFTYTISEDKLSITTSTLGIKNTEEYTFSIEKDKLTLTNDKESITLTKAE